jgi:NADPH:quinone reductase-like Zn-dependent oxidoreductase
MVGVVDQLGPETSVPAIGQAVAALTFYGSYSQFICLSVHDLVLVPSGVDPAEAVSLVLNYVAAYQMLHRVAHVMLGQRILVDGAAGGVGTAFLELGHLAGLQVYGTASKPKHGLVARLGATPIDYRTEDFVGRVAAFTGGVGVDAVFDPMGSAHLKRSVKTVRKGGSVVAYGFYETANRGGNVVLDVLSQYLRLALWSLPPQRKHVAFYDIRPQKKKRPDWFQEDLTALLGLLAAGTLQARDRGTSPIGGCSQSASAGGACRGARQVGAHSQPINRPSRRQDFVRRPDHHPPHSDERETLRSLVRFLTLGRRGAGVAVTYEACLPRNVWYSTTFNEDVLTPIPPEAQVSSARRSNRMTCLR